MAVFKPILLWFSNNKRSRECKGKHEEKFFDLAYRFQHIAGISPVDSTWSYRLYRLVAVILAFSMLISELYYPVNETEVDVIIDSISVTIIHVLCVLRFAAMLWNLKTYTKIIRAMEAPTFDLETEGRKNLMNFWASKNRMYSLMIIITGTCTLTIWYVYPLLDELEYNTPLLVRLPFDYKSKEWYPLVYIMVVLTFHYMSYFVISNDTFSLCMLAHMACQFSLLGDCFKNLLRDSKAVVTAATGREDWMDDQSLDELWRIAYNHKLNKHIRQHQLILENAIDLKRVLSGPMLGQLLGSGMLICFIAYQVTATASENKAKFLMTIWYLAYTLLELYVLCFWCNEINIQCDKVGEAVYYSGWERGTGGTTDAGNLLHIVMVRSRRPIIMTAGGIYDLSLESYMTLVKTSYSALTVLLRMRHK